MSHTPQAERNARLAFLLLCVTVCVCVLLMPIFTVRVIDNTMQSQSIRRNTHDNIHHIMLPTVNSCHKFFRFLAFGSEFRKETVQLICCWLKIRNELVTVCLKLHRRDQPNESTVNMRLNIELIMNTLWYGDGATFEVTNNDMSLYSGHYFHQDDNRYTLGLLRFGQKIF